MRKKKLLLAVLAAIALCLAGEGIFTCVQAYQSYRLEKSYEQTFQALLQKLEKMDAGSFGTYDSPEYDDSYTEYDGFYMTYDTEDEQIKELENGFSDLTGKISAALWADAFLDYDLADDAQYYLYNHMLSNCYTMDDMIDDLSSDYVDVSDDMSDHLDDARQQNASFSKEGDAFLPVLASEKVTEVVKAGILSNLQPSEKNEDIWHDYKIEILSQCTSVNQFNQRLYSFFPNLFKEENVTADDFALRQKLLKQFDTWLENPQKVSPSVLTGSADAKIQWQSDLTEEEKNKLYAIIQDELEKLYEKKQDPTQSGELLDWLYFQESYENFSFLWKMSEKYTQDSSLYSLLTLYDLRTTISYNARPLSNLLAEDASPDRIDLVVYLLNLLCQPDIPLNEPNIIGYVNKCLDAYPEGDALPQLKELNVSFDAFYPYTRSVDLDGDGLPDTETHCTNSENAFYEAQFANGDTLSYKPPENSYLSIYQVDCRDLNHDGKKEMLLFGSHVLYDKPQEDNGQPIEIDIISDTTTKYFCLVMEKKEGSHEYTAIPTKSGETLYHFSDEFSNESSDYSDHWISEFNFS